MKTQWNSLWLVIGMAVIGCGGDDEAAETAVNAEGAEAAAEGAEAAAEGAEATAEGAEESGFTNEESAVIDACNQSCTKEFDECAGSAPEGWYESQNLVQEWPMDLASCSSQCEELPQLIVENFGEECIAPWLDEKACVQTLSCEQFFEYFDVNNEFEGDDEYCGEELNAVVLCALSSIEE